jgi:hypothetical protein
MIVGMFDYVRSSYFFDELFTDKTVFQTKDIEDGIGGTMTDYWIDPEGKLWCPQYHGTHTFEEISEDDERYNDKARFLNFEWIPTGKHGRFVPYEITKYIEIYPEGWNGAWEDWPRLRLHFKRGILQDYEKVPKRSPVIPPVLEPQTKS